MKFAILSYTVLPTSYPSPLIIVHKPVPCWNTGVLAERVAVTLTSLKVWSEPALAVDGRGQQFEINDLFFIRDEI